MCREKHDPVREQRGRRRCAPLVGDQRTDREPHKARHFQGRQAKSTRAGWLSYSCQPERRMLARVIAYRAVRAGGRHKAIKCRRSSAGDQAQTIKRKQSSADFTQATMAACGHAGVRACPLELSVQHRERLRPCPRGHVYRIGSSVDRWTASTSRARPSRPTSRARPSRPTSRASRSRPSSRARPSRPASRASVSHALS